MAPFVPPPHSHLQQAGAPAAAARTASSLPVCRGLFCSGALWAEAADSGLLVDTWLSKRLFLGPTQTPGSLIRPCSTFSLAPAIPEPPFRLPGLSWSAPQGPGQAAFLGPAGLAGEARSWLIPLAFSRRAGGKPEEELSLVSFLPGVLQARHPISNSHNFCEA